MAIFDRIRRGRGSDADVPPAFEPIPPHLLPEVNQRVTVADANHAPVPSRVEDVGSTLLQIAHPGIELELGDVVVLSWERGDAWLRLDTRVTGVDARASVPTIVVSAAGRLSRYDERRRDVRRSVELPIELRVVRARSVRSGRELHTHTVEVSSESVRFMSSAPFAPGDLIEARIRIGDGADDTVGARVRVIRVDTVPGSWRSACTVAFEEVLRSDRARLIAVADAAGLETSDLEPTTAQSAPTTLDGVGGRDEPRSMADLQGVIEWLRRSGD